MTDTKHGIIDWNAVAAIWNPDPFLPPTVTLAELCAYGVDGGFTHLWILPSAHIEPDIEYFRASKAEWDLLPTWELKGAPAGVPNRLRSVTGFRAKHMRAVGPARNSINIIFCGPAAGYSWMRKPDLTMPEAHGMIDFLEKALGVPVGGSPGGAGYLYLLKTEQEHKDWFSLPYVDIDHVTFAGLPWEQAISAMLHYRTPTAAELAKSHLVMIDKNGDFPKGGTEAKFGIGQYQCVSGRRARALWDDPQFDIRTPGMWRVKITKRHSYMAQFPPIESGWLTTPVVRAARENGYEFEVEQAWLARGEYVLKKTMNALWKIRATPGLTDEQRGAIKEVMNDLCGYFHNKTLGENNPKWRPDWYATITGSSFAIKLANMLAFAEKWGIVPIICYVDAFVYAVDKPLAELMPNNLETLGGFKHKWDMEMTGEIRDILTNSSVNLPDRLGLLNDLAEGKTRRIPRIGNGPADYTESWPDDEDEDDEGWLAGDDE